MKLSSLCGVDIAKARIGPLEVLVRGACREDTEMLAEFYKKLSPETLYNRFLTVLRDPRPYIEGVFDKEGVIIVAETNDQIIGSAEIVPITGEIAEVGVVVRDDYQGMGIGRILANALLKAARIVGIREAVAYIQAGNFRAIKLARKLGFKIDENMGDMIKLVLKL